MSARIPRTLLLLAACAALQGCMSEPVALTPFGQPPSDDTRMKPGPLLACTPKNVDRRPQLESGTKPIYPVDELLKNKIAVAHFVFTVAADGTVTPLPIDPAKGAQWFLRHAALASQDWKVTPAIKDGQAVPSICRIDFLYRL